MKMYYVAEVLDWNNGTVRRISPIFDSYEKVMEWDAPDEYSDECLVTVSLQDTDIVEQDTQSMWVSVKDWRK